VKLYEAILVFVVAMLIQIVFFAFYLIAMFELKKKIHQANELFKKLMEKKNETDSSDTE